MTKQKKHHVLKMKMPPRFYIARSTTHHTGPRGTPMKAFFFPCKKHDINPNNLGEKINKFKIHSDLHSIIANERVAS